MDQELKTRTTAMHVRVTGKVQGVCFRDWARATAEKRGLSGWVRNEGDGSVTALLVGPEPDVMRMVDAFWQGPGAASVRDVQAVHVKATAEGPFRIEA